MSNIQKLEVSVTWVQHAQIINKNFNSCIVHHVIKSMTKSLTTEPEDTDDNTGDTTGDSGYEGVEQFLKVALQPASRENYYKPLNREEVNVAYYKTASRNCERFQGQFIK